jgi:hypothetical protein
MSEDLLDPKFMEQYVARVKAAWRGHARSLSWEEKVAAIERMWVRDASLREARERFYEARRNASKHNASDAAIKPADG